MPYQSVYASSVKGDKANQATQGNEPSLEAVRPLWTKGFKREDLFYRYYLGRGSSQESEAAAFEEATRKATEAAIRENYGVDTRIQKRISEDMKDSVIQSDMSEQSGDVTLRRFEEVESYSEQMKTGIFNAWVLFKYPKGEITQERERARVKDSSKKDSTLSTEQGSAKSKIQTQVVIESEPENAEVFIDGDRWGTTPIKISGRITPGRHELKLEHPNYQNRTEKLLVVSKGETTFHRTLKRAQGKITVTGNLAGTRVSINGKRPRLLPMTFTWPAGDWVRLEARHKGVSNEVREFTVEKDSEKEVHFAMITERNREVASVTESDGGAHGAIEVTEIKESLFERISRGHDTTEVWSLGLSVGGRESIVSGDLSCSTFSLEGYFERIFGGVVGVRLGLGLGPKVSKSDVTATQTLAALPKNMTLDSSNSGYQSIIAVYGVEHSSYWLSVPFYLINDRSSRLSIAFETGSTSATHTLRLVNQDLKLTASTVQGFSGWELGYQRVVDRTSVLFTADFGQRYYDKTTLFRSGTITNGASPVSFKVGLAFKW